MKIREYAAETQAMVERFERVASGEEPGEILRLFDACNYRLEDVIMWTNQGLTDDDDVPDYPLKAFKIDWGPVEKPEQLCQEPDVESLVRKAIEEKPFAVNAYFSGKGDLSPLVGHVMKASRGTCNPLVVHKTLRRILDGSGDRVL